MIIMRAGFLVATGVLAAMTVGARAEDENTFHPYFGAAYEHGMLAFKDSNLFGKNLTGYSPFAGITLSRYFAFEMALRMGYGTGGSVASDPTTTTTSTKTIVTDTLTTYHSSSVGVGLDFYVNLPLGKTGLVPFVFTGLAIDTLKEVTQADTTIKTTTIGETATTTDTTSMFTVLHSRSEASPELGAGFAYYYGGAALRVSGRVRNLNMSNSGKYVVTLSAGLLLRV
jgi:hypothetical protein